MKFAACKIHLSRACCQLMSHMQKQLAFACLIVVGSAQADPVIGPDTLLGWLKSSDERNGALTSPVFCNDGVDLRDGLFHITDSPTRHHLIFLRSMLCTVLPRYLFSYSASHVGLSWCNTGSRTRAVLS
jgi:hypothetical protein